MALGYRQIYPPIPVANATRISAKTADSAGGKATLVTLECIAQSNVVDDAIAVTTVTNLTNAPTAGDLTATMKASVTTAATAATPTAAAVTGAVGSVTAAVTLPTIPANWITAAGIATDAGAEIADSVWNDVLASHQTAGSMGAAMSAAGADPWATALPGSYAAGTAGKIVGDKIVASVTGNVGGSVASVTAGVTLAASQHVIVDSGTVTTLTNLPAITAGWLTATGIAASALNGKGDWLLASGYTAPDNATISAVAGYVDTEVGAIKGVIDKLDTAMELDGAVYRFTLNALELAPVGAGGGGLDAAGVRAAVGLASANLDTQLAAVAGDVTAVKGKTDSLAFTAAGKVDANLKAVNDLPLHGSGAAGDLFGV